MKRAPYFESNYTTFKSMKTAQKGQVQGHLAGIGCLLLANAIVIVLRGLDRVGVRVYNWYQKC